MALDGFVVQDPATSAYSIGPQAFAVGSAYEPHRLLNNIARPVMEQLTARCGHASYLGVPAGSHYVNLIAVESTRSIRVSIAEGESRTYHSGATGKALLACMSDDQVRATVGPEPLPKMTPRTIDTIAELLNQLDVIRRTGIALQQEEAMVGAGSLAVGIRDRSGQCMAALSINYPIHIVTDAEIAELGPLVVTAAATISRQLGVMPVPEIVDHELDLTGNTSVAVTRAALRSASSTGGT